MRAYANLAVLAPGKDVAVVRSKTEDGAVLLAKRMEEAGAAAGDFGALAEGSCFAEKGRGQTGRRGEVVRHGSVWSGGRGTHNREWGWQQRRP